MIVPKLRELTSPDLHAGALPVDPDCCSVPLAAVVGPHDGEGGDTFSFSVVTPTYLSTKPITTWGRGMLIVPSFSWSTVSRALDRLLCSAMRDTWPECAAELNKVLHWEFDNYRDTDQ